MTDDAFVHEFFAGLPGGRFGHRDHLRLAWLALRRKGSAEAALPIVEHAIQGFARAHGAERKYHRTLTEFWVRLVEHARSARPELDFDAFLAAFPLLLDPRLAERHWSADELWSEEARGSWVEPDLVPLP
jgi:hypothetical protein